MAERIEGERMGFWCRIRHAWEPVGSLGVYDYVRCRRCGAREARKAFRAHGVINWWWLRGETENLDDQGPLLPPPYHQSCGCSMLPNGY